MDGSKPPHKIAAWDRLDSMIGEQFVEQLERELIGGIAEFRHQNGTVDEGEVAVAGRKLFAVECDALRNGQRDDVECLVDTIQLSCKFRAQSFEWFVVWIASVGALCDDHGRRVDEASQLIDVSIGVIAGKALSNLEPHDVAQTEPGLEDGFHAFARHVSIAPSIEQA